MTLVLALTIGSAGQTPLAQAAPASDTGIVNISMHAHKGPQTICPRDKVNIDVNVVQEVEIVGEGPGSGFGFLTGIEVEASVIDSSIGTISPAKNSTKLDNDTLGAYFTFSAKKPGTTTISFKGKINKRVLLGLVLNSDTVTTEMAVTVEDCKYKVTTFSRWRVPGPANVNIKAMIDAAGMTKTGEGRYEGTASVIWIVTAGQVEDCIPQVMTASSQAELYGEVLGPEEFIVNVAYQPAMVTLPGFCVGESGGIATGSREEQLTPDSLTFTVPASGGGKQRLVQNLEGWVVGDAVVHVWRVIGK